MDNLIDDVGLILENLTSEQMSAFQYYMTPEDIDQMFEDMKYEIAEELLRRVKSKANVVYNAGWSLHGGIASSLYYEITNDSIEIKSTKDYFHILEEGFQPFDMKKSLLGKTVKIRLPGGQIVNPYRVVSDSSTKLVINQNPKLFRKKTKIQKKFYATKNWIHPGFAGRNIVKAASAEMHPWILNHIKDSIMKYIQAFPNSGYNLGLHGAQYERRDASGRFI